MKHLDYIVQSYVIIIMFIALTSPWTIYRWISIFELPTNRGCRIPSGAFSTLGGLAEQLQPFLTRENREERYFDRAGIAHFQLHLKFNGQFCRPYPRRSTHASARIPE